MPVQSDHLVSQERQLKYVHNSGPSNAFKCPKLGQGIFLLYNILQCILELTVVCHILLDLTMAGTSYLEILT